MNHAGEIAALGTAICWAISTNLFATVGRKMSPGVLNRLRITIACVFLGIALLATRGSPWPFWATGFQMILLAASGLIGFVFGDHYYFRSLAILGPGRASLLASTAPIFTVLLAWPLLGEFPGPLAILGMALTLGGIFIVLKTRTTSWVANVKGSLFSGVTAGVFASIGQAAGYVISKEALRSGLDPLSATIIRIVAAAGGIWMLALFRGETTQSFAAFRHKRASMFLLAGSFVGPFLGVTLSLVAIHFIETGVAASITAIYPVLALLISWRFHGERLTLRTLAGTIVAISGVVVLFMR